MPGSESVTVLAQGYSTFVFRYYRDGPIDA